MRRPLAIALLSVAVIALGAAPASAHPVDHRGAVLIRNLRPGFGTVVPAGPVDVVAQVVADRPIVASEVLLDGRVVPSQRGGPDASHPSVAATVLVEPGEHIVEVRAADDAGRTNGRAWRFHASGVRIDRIAGADRIATAVAVSRALYPTGATAGAVVLARADEFPDALAGAPLAHAVDAPLLLTPPDRLADEVAAEIERVTQPGATVHLLGGERALSPAVAAAVEAGGRLVERHAGDNRFATAAAVAGELGAADTAVVVNGFTFADALAASVPAAVNGRPVLLTQRDSVPGETLDALAAAGVDDVVVVGGDAAVGPSAAAQLDEAVAGGVQRLSGPDRYATALAVARASFPTLDRVALASGERFPDALAGARHAAAAGIPLVLTAGGGLPFAVGDAMSSWTPDEAVIYGGFATVSTVVDDDLRRAVADAGSARIFGTAPAPGAVVHSLDTVVVGFERELRPEHSMLTVTLGDQEVSGTYGTGDFPDVLTFTVGALPSDPPVGQPVPVRVTGVGFDGTAFRHIDFRFTYLKLDLALGDSGHAVLDLQHRLTSMGYWLGNPDGSFGTLTQQALTAFQKVHGLPRTGTYERRTREAMARAGRPVARTTAGTTVEIDKARQVIFIVRDGRVAWVFNTSTGTEKPYTYEGRTYLADTPPGRWRISREVDGIREGNLGRLYRPKYFHADGIAVHGSSSVPPYPASHGCARVTNPAMDFIWGAGLMPIGMPVWVY